jgi:hypothetical protein
MEILRKERGIELNGTCRLLICLLDNTYKQEVLFHVINGVGVDTKAEKSKPASILLLVTKLQDVIM